MICIIAVGRRHESWVVSGIERYEKRLKKPFMVQWQLIPHSSVEGARAREEESERLLLRLKSTDFVILLDERGDMHDSVAFSRMIEAPLQRSQRIAIIVGGAYGVSEQVRVHANVVWSLSKLVFPHQLVRLMLIEQLYRAQEIAAEKAYHHP